MPSSEASSICHRRFISSAPLKPLVSWNRKSPLFGYLHWVSLHVIMARPRVRQTYDPKFFECFKSRVFSCITAIAFD